MTAVDIPSIRAPLIDRITRTAQKLANGFVNRYYEVCTTIDFSSVHYDPSEEVPFSSQASYTIGQSYGKDVQRSAKLFRSKNRRGSKKLQGPTQEFQQKRLCPL